MSAEILVSLGRVVYINFGEFSGKLAVITDIIDGKRVILANPTAGMKKHAISNRRIALTRFLIPAVTPTIRATDLKQAIEAYKLTDKFNASGLGKRIQKQNKRATLTDFERFKVQVLKKKLSKALRTHVNKNRKALIAKAK